MKIVNLESATGYFSGIDCTLPSRGLREHATEPASHVTHLLSPPTRLERKDLTLAEEWRIELRLDDERNLNKVALRAVEELKVLLQISENRVAQLVDISRNSIRNWRNGQGAYPSTTSKLFQISHLISALDATMSQQRMLVWLNEPDNSNSTFTRLETLAQPGGPAIVSQQASHLLFPSPPRLLPSPDEIRKELERIDLEAKGWMDVAEAPHQYSARLRRKRPDTELEQ